MSGVSMPIKYSIFASVSIFVNISLQYFVLSLYSGAFSLYLAMFVGTLAGLVTKFYLDKRYIFYFETKSKNNELFTFVAYAITGVFTTLIFWSTEIVFNLIFSFGSAKYVGALIGLVIGYTVKYFADSQFVFKRTKQNKGDGQIRTAE